jgi:predicted DNA-binding transcriptional regulator YafY
MSRAARLVELLIRLRSSPRVTAQELADHFEVSRRTILRDLQVLSDLGVTFAASPGPGGGYTLSRDQRLAPLALTVNEALGLLMSYEAFLRYAQSPFASDNLSALTKLRAILPRDVARELERMRMHVAVVQRPAGPQAPLLGDLLQAALDGVHLSIKYDSRSGLSQRVIFPFGLYAANGCWYCACYDEKRGKHLSLRADRVSSVARLEGRDRPPHIPVAQWPGTRADYDGQGLHLSIAVTPAGMRSLDLQTLFEQVQPDGHGGGIIEGFIPRAEVDWFASQLLRLGAAAVVESPPELIEAIRSQAAMIAGIYGG